jgi:hypothetical protein
LEGIKILEIQFRKQNVMPHTRRSLTYVADKINYVLRLLSRVPQILHRALFNVMKMSELNYSEYPL